ncbi:hypothetical protein DL98DRAFT_373041, partial [Cadophora sp. DSE1049]
HRPLSDPSMATRLLRLHPASDTSSPLSGSLVEVPLEDLQDYEAISYTWDDQIHTLAITCDGDELLVTANCEDALLPLREEAEERVLWIDSISFDQSSVPEKSAQAALMGAIYRQAKMVLVGL